jgi:ABC-type sugar transport system ATPase subunit
MRNGTLVETLDARETTADQLAVAVVGHEIRGTPRHADAAEMNGRKILLDVQGLSWAHDGSAFSLALHEGEILGITGPEGAGKSELLRTIFGLMPQAKGTVTFDGQVLARRSPRDMLRRGAAFVPEDRFTEGLLLNRSIEENVSLPHVALQGGIFAEGKRLRSEASRKTAQIRTKMASIESPVKDLSGGNQQKVVISRWLEDRYRLLLLDEPYKGIDIGAKDDINEEIRTMAAGGRGVVVISTEFAELVGLVTTLLVVVNRKIVAKLTGEAITPHEIVRYYQYEVDAPAPSAEHPDAPGTSQSAPLAH